MPNWCENQLVIEGPKEDLEDIISHSFMFEQYFPTPLFHSEIFDKKNMARKECLLLPLRTVLKALQ